MAPTLDDLYITLRAPTFTDPDSLPEGRMYSGRFKLLRRIYRPGESLTDLRRRCAETGQDPRQYLREVGEAADQVGWQFLPGSDLWQPWIVFDDEAGANQVVLRQMLEQLGSSAQDVYAAARANHANLLRDHLRIIESDSVPGKFVVVGERAARCAALLHTPEVFEAWRQRVQGELLVIPPRADDIMLLGSDAEYLPEAITAATRSFEAGGELRLSPLPYRIVDDPIQPLQPWQPPPESPAAEAVREADVVARLSVYQESILGAIDDYFGDPDWRITVPVQRGRSESTGRPFTCAVINVLIGPEHYMPLVDFIGFENQSPRPDHNGLMWVPMDRLRSLGRSVFEFGVPLIAFPGATPWARFGDDPAEVESEQSVAYTCEKILEVAVDDPRK